MSALSYADLPERGDPFPYFEDDSEITDLYEEQSTTRVFARIIPDSQSDTYSFSSDGTLSHTELTAHCEGRVSDSGGAHTEPAARSDRLVDTRIIPGGTRLGAAPGYRYVSHS